MLNVGLYSSIKHNQKLDRRYLEDYLYDGFEKIKLNYTISYQLIYTNDLHPDIIYIINKTNWLYDFKIQLCEYPEFFKNINILIHYKNTIINVDTKLLNNIDKTNIAQCLYTIIYLPSLLK
jgi:hypothetical protein